MIGRRKRINLSSIRGMNMSSVAHQADEVNELINLRPTPNGLEGRNGAKTIMNTISNAIDYRIRYIKGSGQAKAISNQGLLEYNGSSKWNYIGEIANLISKDATNGLNTLFFDTDYPDVFIKSVVDEEQSELVVLEPCVYLVWNSSKKDDDQSLALWSYNMKLKSIMNAGLCITPTSLNPGTYPGLDKYCIDNFICLSHDPYWQDSLTSYYPTISLVSQKATKNGYIAYVVTDKPFDKVVPIGQSYVPDTVPLATASVKGATAGSVNVDGTPTASVVLVPTTKVFQMNNSHFAYASTQTATHYLVHSSYGDWYAHNIGAAISHLDVFRIPAGDTISGGTGRVTADGTTVTLSVASAWSNYISIGDAIIIGEETRYITGFNSATELTINSTITVTNSAYSIVCEEKFVYIYTTSGGTIGVCVFELHTYTWLDFDTTLDPGTVYDVKASVVSSSIEPPTTTLGSLYKIFYIRDIAGVPTLCHRTIILTTWYDIERNTISDEIALTTGTLTLTTSHKIVSPRWILYNSSTSYLINNYLILHDGQNFYRWAYKYTASTYACVEDMTTIEFTKNIFPLVSGELLDIYIPPDLFYKQKLNQHLPVPIRPYFNYTTDTETWDGVKGTGTVVWTVSTPDNTLTGTGTKFLTELNVGDYIRLDTNLIAKVLSITSDTVLTLNSSTASAATTFYIYRTIDLYNVPVLPNYQIPLNLNTGYPTKFNPATLGTTENLRWKYWLFYMLTTPTVDGAPEATRLLRGYYNNSGEYTIGAWGTERAGELYLDKKFNSDVFNVDNILLYTAQDGGKTILKPEMTIKTNTTATPVEFGVIYYVGAPAILVTIVNITDSLDSVNKKAVQITITSASADCGFCCTKVFYVYEGTTYIVKFRAKRNDETPDAPLTAAQVEMYENGNRINKIMAETITITETATEYEFEFTSKKSFILGRSNGVLFAIKTNATGDSDYTVQVWDISITEKESFNAVVPWKSWDDERFFLTDYIVGKTYNTGLDYKNNALYIAEGGLFYYDRGNAWVFPDKPISGDINDYGLWVSTKRETYLIQGSDALHLSRNLVVKQGLDEEDRYGLAAFGKIAVLFNDSSVYLFVEGNIIDIGINVEPYINKHAIPKYASIDERNNSIWININIAGSRNLSTHGIDTGVAIFDIVKNSWRIYGYNAKNSLTTGYIGGVQYASPAAIIAATGSGHYISFIMFSKLFKSMIGGLRYDDAADLVEVINFEVDDDYARDTMIHNNEYWDKVVLVLMTHEMSLDNPGVMKKIRRLELNNFTLRVAMAQFTHIYFNILKDFNPFATTDTSLYSFSKTNYNTLYPNSLSFNTGLQINGYSFTLDFIIYRTWQGDETTTIANPKLVMKDLFLELIDIDRTRRGGF